MANKVQLKRSAVPGKVPSTTDLDLGELGINTYDGKLYLKKNDGSASIVEIGAGGGGSGIAWQSVQSSNFTAVGNRAYPVNTTAGRVTVTFPASPVAGSVITLADYAGTWAESNKGVVVNPNGLKIIGTTDNRLLNEAREGISFVYVDSTQGWIPFSGFNEVTPPTNNYAVTVLMVAGGGGGGSTGANYCGGGGAGGCLYFGTETSSNTNGTPKTPNGGTKTAVPETSYSIVIGAGGGAESTGSNTTAFGETALGGGWGRGNAYAASGGAGGSGGGGTAASGAGGSGTTGQGYKGGFASSANQGGSDSGAGGGGGAQQSGGDISAPTFRNSSGAGGEGVQYNMSGSLAYYAAGGVGSGRYELGGTNGIGGSSSGGAGAVNTGSGGGGGRSSGGGAGGSGVVIIRYAGPQRGTGGTVTSANGYTYHKFTSSGTFTA